MQMVITLCRLTEFAPSGVESVDILVCPFLASEPPSILSIYCRKSLVQPVIVVPTSHALKWRLSKNSIKSEFC